jgi:anti-sigma regulatory factor (Ser/Thr protein kinase)
MSASGALRVTLPPDETAPRRARAFLRDARCPNHDSAVFEDAVLLVSELVTNAVRHATPPITLEVACEAPDGLSIRVTDGSALQPSGRALTSHEESGRGIALVDVLSQDWGVEPAEAGKAVWFRLSAPCAAAAGEGRVEPTSSVPTEERTLAGSHGTPGG